MQEAIQSRPEEQQVPAIAADATGPEGLVSLRYAGILMIAGVIVATVFNVLFPRADDPADTTAVLTMMAENQVLRQVSFLGVTVGLLIVTAGVAGVIWALNSGRAQYSARIALYGLLIGAGIFTASAGIGLAATEAAIDWVAAGSDTSSSEFVIAAAMNHADDGVWAISLVVYWGALGLTGIALLQDERFPRWSGWAIMALGFGVAAFAGVPMAVQGVSQGLTIVFAVLAQLSLIWVLVVGIWILRNTR
jgi:hypothetical protein